MWELREKKVYLVIGNSLAPQSQPHHNQNLRLKRRGKNLELLQTTV